MKILVIDDNPRHRQSAQELLAGHEVTIARNFHEAKEILNVKTDWQEVSRLEEKGVVEGEAIKRATLRLDFDVMLCDLMMPKGSTETMGPKGREYVNEEMGYGYVLPLMAARAGIPKIAVVTDAGHHDHPMPYIFDFLGGHNGLYSETDFVVNGSQVMFRFCPGFTKEGGKCWDKVLAWILGQNIDEAKFEIRGGKC